MDDTFGVGKEPAQPGAPMPVGEIERNLFARDRATRLSAAGRLQSVPAEQAAGLLNKVIAHWDRRLRAACAPALVQKAGASAATILVNGARASRLPKKLVLELLSHCDTPASVQYLMEYARRGRSILRSAARESLGKLACEEAAIAMWLVKGRVIGDLKPRLDAIPVEKLARYISWCDPAEKVDILDVPQNRRYLEKRGVSDSESAIGLTDEATRFARIGRAFRRRDVGILRQYFAEEIKGYYFSLTDAQRVRAQRNPGLNSLLAEAGVETFFPLQSQGQKLLAETSSATGVSPKLLGWAAGKWKKMDDCYRTEKIPKKRGGTRALAVPCGILKTIQRGIYDGLVARVETHPACHGFRKWRSTITNAGGHTGKAIVLNLDLGNFFPSITAGRVYGIFKSLGLELPMARFLTRLTTHAGALPQGAPTSPALANLVCRRLDRRLGGLGAKIGAHYTRYADDLSFSGGKEIQGAMRFIRKIIEEEGFSVCEEKVRLTRQGNRQEVTGLTVNSRVAVPRRERRRLRAALHRLKNGKKAEWDSRPAGIAVIRGVAAWVKSVHPELGARYLEELAAIEK